MLLLLLLLQRLTSIWCEGDSVTMFDFSLNGLSLLTPSLSLLTNLRYINSQGATLKAAVQVSSNIGSGAVITQDQIDWCALNTLPHLSLISLYSLSLTSLPSCFGSTDNGGVLSSVLMYLDLSANSITAFPTSLSSFHSLIYVSLQGNRGTGVVVPLQTMIGLQYVDLR